MTRRTNQTVVQTLTAILLIGFCCENCDAQLFGSRSIRRNINRQRSSNVGLVVGNERYIRGNRGNSFVGADQNELQGFVGSEQGRTSGQVASPTGGLKRFVDRTTAINRPLPQLQKNDFYPGSLLLPRELITAISSPPDVSLLNQSLTDELNRKVNDSIEVLVVGRIATLRGEVASAKDKTLAELLIRFEPGIDDVRNEIVIPRR